MMTIRLNRETKARHWAQWKASGLSQKAYCERHGFNLSSFKNWGTTAPRYPLVPVQVTPPLVDTGYRVLVSGIVIEVPKDATLQQWQALLAALGQRESC